MVPGFYLETLKSRLTCKDLLRTRENSGPVAAWEEEKGARCPGYMYLGKDSVSPESYFSYGCEVGKCLSSISSVRAMPQTEGGAEAACMTSASSWPWVLYCTVTYNCWMPACLVFLWLGRLRSASILYQSLHPHKCDNFSPIPPRPIPVLLPG